MAKQKRVEEDSKNSEEQESEEQTSEGETPEGEGSSEDYSESERQLYARAKKAESRLKDLEQKNEKLAELIRGKKSEDKTDKGKVEQDDIDRIVQVQRATKDLEPEAIAELKKRADVEKVSLAEARENENFQIWLKGFREKVESEEKTAESSSRSPRTGGKETSKMSKDELRENFSKLAREAVRKGRQGRKQNI